MSEKSHNSVHKLLGRILQELLTPLNVMVKTGVRLMAESPEADILLLRRDAPRWTRAQRELLPDGIRDTTADHILIEFKNTESINRRVLYQALAYRYFYLEGQRLKRERLHTVIVSAKTPIEDFREKFDFSVPRHAGVWQSRNKALDVLQVLVLNDLSDAPHNQYIKCFATQKKVRLRAIQLVLASGLKHISRTLAYIFLGLLKLYGVKMKGDPMLDFELTPEKVLEIGKGFEDAILACLPLEKRLEGLDPEDVLSRFKPEDVLSRFKPEERLVGLKPEDILESLSSEDILAWLKKKQEATDVCS